MGMLGRWLRQSEVSVSLGSVDIRLKGRMCVTREVPAFSYEGCTPVILKSREPAGPLVTTGEEWWVVFPYYLEDFKKSTVFIPLAVECETKFATFLETGLAHGKQEAVPCRTWEWAWGLEALGKIFFV